MSEPFLAEIRPFAGNFAPVGWALCNGQLLSISQNSALFSLLGTTYGGDGKVNFALPNLQGCAPMHWGDGTGLTSRQLGETGGSTTVPLDETQLPAHTHAAMGSGQPATSNTPGDNILAATSTALPAYSPATGALVPLSPVAVAQTGGGQPHNNMQPYLALTFIIATTGVYPQRS